MALEENKKLTETINNVLRKGLNQYLQVVIIKEKGRKCIQKYVFPAFLEWNSIIKNN
jgi:hypothetical protein